MEYYDVLVAGGGGAAVAAARVAAGLGARVLLASKEPLGCGDTRISMGLQVYPAVLPEDSPERLEADMLAGGEGLADPGLVKIMAAEACHAMAEVEQYGHLFRRDETGSFSTRVAYHSGGHSMPCTITSPGGAGIGIGRVLRQAVAGFTVREETMVCRLLQANGRINGAVLLDLASGAVETLHCGAVVLATGGAGWLYYPHTDCSRGVTGDGFALALDAGAELVDMEQVQFIPFGLTHPSSYRGVYLGEASVAMPVGRLLDARGGMVLEQVGNLTRAELSRIMALALAEGRGTQYGGLLLDLSPILALPDGKHRWQRRREQGQMEQVLWAYGERAYRWEEPWDVCPTAHYFMGGVRVDSSGATAVTGLYAAGQCMGGLHGGNRLGSVSLGELFVFGKRAGAAAASWVLDCARPDQPEAGAGQDQEALFGRSGKNSPLALTRRLQKVMWDMAGPARTEEGLRQALAELEELQGKSADLAVGAQQTYNLEVQEALELRSLLATARAVLLSALARKETRGAHLRLDYPGRTAGQPRHLVLGCPDGEWRVREEVPA